MKYIVHISRVLVGALFIISGLIKLNDPLGFSYKLQEYFSADVLNMPFLEPYALAIALFTVILEVVLGVFLLIGYKRKFTVWSLLALIVFFTFLTFYSAYFDKVKDCGCFGDALKLTPWESFTKDVILLVFILILFIGVKHVKPIFKGKITTILAVLSVLVSGWFGYHVLHHLPTKDFRAYKIGDNLIENMSVPEDAPKPVVDYFWTFNVNGEEQVFKTNGSYPTVEGDYVGVETKLIEEGYEPPILDFSIESSEDDLTEQFLNEDHLIMIVAYNLESAKEEGALALKEFSENAIRKGYKVIGITSSGDDAKQLFNDTYHLNFDWYLCDEKALKTVVRSNPGVLELQNGTVMQKEHWRDLDDLQLQTLENARPSLNFDLKKQLDSILIEDQRYRGTGNFDDWGKQLAIDSSNIKFIDSVISKMGYPGKSKVGERTNNVAWYVIQHSNKIADYLPIIKEAASNDELPKRLAATMEDRYLMQNNKMQIYGTQGSSYGLNSNNPIDFIWPIEAVEGVNERRREAGFDSTVEAYAKDLFGEDFEFRNYTIEEVNKIIESFNN